MRSRSSSRAARTGALAAAPEIHRSMRHYHHAWAEFSTINGAAYAAAFGQETADRLIRFPLINAGVFALKADAPHWQGWADLLGESLQRSADMTDQIALNVLVYDHGFACEPLPSRCNWPIHHATPAWDAGRGAVRRAGDALRPARHPAHDDLHQAAGDAWTCANWAGRTPARSGRARCAGRDERPYSATWRQRRSSRCTGWATISSCSMRRPATLDLPVARRRAIADRRLGVGCDQLIVLEPPTDRDGRRLHAHLQSRRRRGRRLRQRHALRRLGADGRAQDRRR